MTVASLSDYLVSTQRHCCEIVCQQSVQQNEASVILVRNARRRYAVAVGGSSNAAAAFGVRTVLRPAGLCILRPPKAAIPRNVNLREGRKTVSVESEHRIVWTPNEAVEKVVNPSSVCSFTAALVWRNGAQGNSDRQRSMVVESSA